MDISYKYNCLKWWNYLLPQKINRQNKEYWKCTRLEVDEAVLVQLNLVHNQYQQKSVVLYISMPSESYVYLLNVEQKGFKTLYH